VRCTGRRYAGNVIWSPCHSSIVTELLYGIRTNKDMQRAGALQLADRRHLFGF